jgi:hypothetical protein
MIGGESPRGTAGTLDYSIPVESGKILPKREKTDVTSGFGTIGDMSDSYITKYMSEIALAGELRAKSSGVLLYGTFGTEAAPSLLETGVYAHAFTVLNTNQHPSFTVVGVDGTQQYRSLYSMIEKLDLSFTVGEKVMFDATLMGQDATTTTGATPAYVATDEVFLVSNVSVKFATNQAGLAGASRTPVRSINLSIEKNLFQDFLTKSSASEALTFASQENQQIAMSGDLEFTYETTTLRGLFEAGTYQAMEIEVVGRTLIGATQYNKLVFQFMKCDLRDFDMSDSNDDVRSMTMGFVALTPETTTCTLINTIAVVYA